jgi:hypothetical protein
MIQRILAPAGFTGAMGLTASAEAIW